MYKIFNLIFIVFLLHNNVSAYSGVATVQSAYENSIEEQEASLDEKYFKQLVEPEWKQRIESDIDFLENQGKLYTFLKEKERLLADLFSKRRSLKDFIRYADKESILKNIELLKQKYEEALKNRGSIFMSRYEYLIFDRAGVFEDNYAYTGRIYDVDEKKSVVDTSKISYWKQFWNKRLSAVNDAEESLSKLESNISSVRQDITKCENEMSGSLPLKAKENEQKNKITLYFTVLIGLLLLAFFGTLLWKADGGLATLMLSTKGLQFITVFVIIIAVVLFGILGILKGELVAPILSGISGYILGNGANQIPPLDNRHPS